MLFCLVLIGDNMSEGIQLHLVILLILGQAIYLIASRPYKEINKLRMEIFNELITLTICYAIIPFLDQYSKSVRLESVLSFMLIG